MRNLAFALLFPAGAALGAAPEEFSTAAGPLQIVPIQHASLILKAGGKVMYVDPAQGSYDGLPQADYILITDIHGDHMAPAIVDKLRKPGTVILAPKAVAAQVTGCTVISNGESKTIGPFQVEAIPMYNLTADRLQYHPKGRGNGYVVTLWRQAILFFRRHRGHAGNEGAAQHRRGLRVHEPALHHDARRKRRRRSARSIRPWCIRTTTAAKM